MNAAQILLLHPWVSRLGWTLVHFLWQGLAIVVLYEAARRAMLRASSPHSRYLLACAALAAMAAAPLVTWAMLQPSGVSLQVAHRIASAPRPLSSPASAPASVPSTSFAGTAAGAGPSQFLLWVVMLWLSGAVVFWIRLAGGWMAAGRMRSMLVRPAPAEWQDALNRLGTRIGVSRPVRLLVSALVQVPTVVGWLRPVVLVPVGALAGLPAEHLEALLLHELAHIRRHDYLVNILQSIAEALLFYHPAVWWVSGHIRAERELCCDDLVVAVSRDALTYARALARLESYRPAYSGAVLAAGGGRLADRIARLLGQPRTAARAGLGPGVVAVAILLIAAAYGIFAQPVARPEFQSVSIKRSTPNQPGISMSSNASLLLLIQFAYAPHDNPMAGHTTPLPASDIVGGPDWIRSERYDIDAKPAPNTDPKMWWQMWQTLLADRFQLKLHKETREMPVYVLTAAKSGIKLPPAQPADCVSFPPGTRPHFVRGKVDCGYVSGPGLGFGPGLGMMGRKVRIADFAKELALILDRPVVDKTGFSGEFDLKLNFSPDASLAGFPGHGGPPVPGLPNIFAALEDQLGLRLTPSTAPVQVLVIDRAEKPVAD